MAQAALDACRRKLPPGYAETPPATVPTGEHPILPTPPGGEHPSGLPSPAPLPPEPQALPSPATETKKPLEVPAEPSKSSAAPTRGVPTPAAPTPAAPTAAVPTSAPLGSSYVAIVDVKPVAYEARKAPAAAARQDRPVGRTAEQSAEHPSVVLRVVIPGEK